MPIYSKAARRWVEPLLALGAGGRVTLRFLAPGVGAASELGIVPDAPESYADYPAPASFTRELTAEEILTLGGQFHQGAREVLLSDTFAQQVAAAQGTTTPRQMFEAAAGIVLDGRVSRIRAIKPLQAGDETYAWQLLCDAPLEAA